jgi:hypothetical protein
MDIQNKKLSPIDFCIMVFWIHGWSTGQIHEYFARERGKTKAAVRGVINRIQTRRERMTRADRQKFLDAMKEGRIDDGRLEEAFFKAKALKTDSNALYGPPERSAPAKAPRQPDPDLKTRKGRKEAKRRAKLEKEQDAQKEADREERAQGGAVRGPHTYPLDYLYFARLLADKNEHAKQLIDKTSNESNRNTSGQVLRARFDASMLSGVKSQSYEIMGTTSGKGFTVTYRVMEARRMLEEIRAMAGGVLYSLLERFIRHDEFLWEGARDPEAVLEQIRCALDIVTLYDGYLASDDFARRWGFEPEIPVTRSRAETRDIAASARDMIARAQRAVR